MTTTYLLVQVDAPHFCAGIDLEDSVVVRAAPILAWCIGMRRYLLSAYFKKKGWRATIAATEKPTDSCGVAQLVARLLHTQQAAGSSPASAPT